MHYTDLGGEYSVTLSDGKKYTATLPGTLDKNEIGEREKVALKWHPDAAIDETGTFTDCGKILTRLTRKHAYEGRAVYERSAFLERKEGERLFIEAERSRELSLRVNGREVPLYEAGSISTPHVFEITDYVFTGENDIAFACDNSYPGWTHDPIVFSSAATDESQTNWNGLIGYVRIAAKRENFISAVRVYPSLKKADVTVEFDCSKAVTDTILLESCAFGRIERAVSLKKGKNVLRIRNILFAEEVRYWDEDEGNLYELTVSADGFEKYTTTFGVRTLSCIGGRLALNGRVVFLRSETSSAIYPEEGHIAMTKARWLEILKQYKAYGVNSVRFHSHCPPEAAFAAADELGMILQPELSQWNPKTAFESDGDYAYYKTELTEILHTYCNHPSFISLTFGNELAAESKGHKRMDLLLQYAKKTDATRLFSDGSNNHYGWLGPNLSSDFYTGTNCYEHELRATFAGMGGYLNRDYPDARHNFDKQMRFVREEFKKPVLEFEVGQYEILPDFDELELFRGVTEPDNYIRVKERVEEKGLTPVWKEYVNATGELALRCYREEVEACLRTEEMSGISLLSLQDFPGQGTALVGMMNSHLLPKPFDFARPERFAAFFKSVLPLALLEKYTYYEGENLAFTLKFANYGKKDVTGKVSVKIFDEAENAIACQTTDEKCFKRGRLHTVKRFEIALPSIERSQKYTLKVCVGEAENFYPVWVYRKEKWRTPAGVTVTDSVATALERLKQGGRVLLSPLSDEAHFPGSVKAQFSTDFWSVGTFPSQSGFMGCYVKENHPALASFPTQSHSDWQWWQLTHHRAMALPDSTESIVKGLDCYARMRNISLLFEVKIGEGKLLLTSMNLLADARYPEVNAMLVSLCAYVSSPSFDPGQTMSEEDLKKLVSDRTGNC